MLKETDLQMGWPVWCPVCEKTFYISGTDELEAKRRFGLFHVHLNAGGPVKDVPLT